MSIFLLLKIQLIDDFKLKCSKMDIMATGSPMPVILILDGPDITKRLVYEKVEAIFIQREMDTNMTDMIMTQQKTLLLTAKGTAVAPDQGALEGKLIILRSFQLHKSKNMGLELIECQEHQIIAIIGIINILNKAQQLAPLCSLSRIRTKLLALKELIIRGSTLKPGTNYHTSRLQQKTDIIERSKLRLLCQALVLSVMIPSESGSNIVQPKMKIMQLFRIRYKMSNIHSSIRMTGGPPIKKTGKVDIDMRNHSCRVSTSIIQQGHHNLWA